MTRTIPPPAMPMGTKFDPAASLTDNARDAWQRQQELDRQSAERQARLIMRKVFGRDDLKVDYNVHIGLTTPTFVIDDELIAHIRTESGAGLALIEFCSECGEEFKFHQFGSLAGLGRRLAERDESEPYVCRMCALIKGGK